MRCPGKRRPGTRTPQRARGFVFFLHRFRVRVWSLELKGEGLEFRIWGLGFRIWGLGHEPIGLRVLG